MSDGYPLAARFVENLAPARRGQVTVGPALEATLAAFVEGAASGFPGLGVAPEELVAHLAARLDEGEPPLEALLHVNGADLYLVFAAFRREPAAEAAIMKIAERAIAAALRRYNPSGTLVEDVTQHVSELLFVGGPDGIPKLSLYSGRGSLRAWLKVIALRAARRLAAAHCREQPSDNEALAEILVGDEGDEIQRLKPHYRAAFKRAFQAALGALSHWDKTLLRKHLLEARSIDQLASLHRVHRATVARWLAVIRQTLFEETRRRLMADLKLDAPELDEVMELIESRLSASVERILGKT